MKTSKAFKKTLKCLWDGNGSRAAYDYNQESEFICIASDIADRNRNRVTGDLESEKIYDIVQPIMQKTLGKHSTLVCWLVDQHPELGVTDEGHPDLTYDQFKLKIQVTRKAWLKSLIAEYKAKGD